MTPTALEELRYELAGVGLELELPGAEQGRHVRDELVRQVDDYLLPRLRRLDAPLLMVVGGSTGAGKSTLVNSLVGSEVSPAGVLRPTTRAPVLACNPDDLSWFEDGRVLPQLARTTGGQAAPGTLQLAQTAALPAGLALLDSPDIDSVATENRALAGQLLAAADAWLFVTTAARYADAVPWELLHAARDRSTSLALVLNRVPRDATEEVSAHLGQMLRERGLGGTELLVVPESELETGLLPPQALAPVRRWLDALAADAQSRAALIQRTLAGALASIPARVAVVQTAVEAQAAAVEELGREVETSYERALEEVDETLRSGSLLRGEVLARWYEVVGTGDVMRALESRVAWARDWVRSALSGRPRADTAVKEAVETGIEAVVRAAAERAADRAVTAWRGAPAGAPLLARAPRLDTASAGLAEKLEREVRDWQGSVFDLVREEGMDKRTTARIASLGVNGAGLTVMLAVFVQTGGLTGAEVAIAGGTSAIGQKVLEAIFGDQAVRALAAKAREDLIGRVRRLLDAEAERFTSLLAAADADREAPERLDAALAGLEPAR
jgi:hypothetical protein